MAAWSPGCLPDASQMPARCLPDVSQMPPGCSRPRCLPDVSQMLPRCLQDASRCLQMPPDASRCLQMHPDASRWLPRCLQMSQIPPDASRCFQMLPDASRCLQMHPRCLQMLPRCFSDAFQMPPGYFPDASLKWFLVNDPCSMTPWIGLQRNSVWGLALGSFCILWFKAKARHFYKKRDAPQTCQGIGVAICRYSAN